MRIKILSGITVPGNVPSNKAFVASVLAMAMVFVIDVLTPAHIRLHLLYIFPLACIALHCARLGLVVAAVFSAAAMQAFTFIIHHASLPELVTDSIVSFAVTVLIVVLSRSLRENFLKIAKIAEYDSLTALRNRRSFSKSTMAEIARQTRYGGVFSLAIVDLDKFKELNDSKGHFAGDSALEIVARVLTRQTRNTDIIGRIGGDEFAILMPYTAKAACRQVCRNLMDIIATETKDAGFAVTASIGSVTFDQPPESLAIALQLADRAMYAVKNAKFSPDI